MSFVKTSLVSIETALSRERYGTLVSE